MLLLGVAAGHPSSDSGREATRRLRRVAWLAAASLDGGRCPERARSALRAVVAAVSGDTSSGERERDGYFQRTTVDGGKGHSYPREDAIFSQRWTSRSGLSGYLARNPVPPHGVRRCPVPSRGASGLGAMHAPRPAPQPISAGRLPTRFCAPSLIPLPLPPPPRAPRPAAATRGAAARRAPPLCRI